ncbi:DHA2 family efflux MFS transporter permease subunit [Cohnella cholangitidis]|uniref:DHA2 family efflux MFS transporter permease subunit n=1 Tax=Cohnella cholangitidis TaxID=2598458 RepID=A0A7G5C5Q5_9BACL|nr:DHA2 family efflux MFS transporter permease subunit [Cohnella cholangitidis]QMV44539.1 DHA2 family efflux MFS transporter permease subunit [Cohnella cholangitidis]
MRKENARKWWVLGALTFGLLAISLDLTILNVALPTLASDLDASTSSLQWIVDSYNLVLAAILLPAGMLGDRYGRKKFLLAALVLFGLASAGCALADSSEMLIVMRCFLGLGAAFIMPLSMSILPVLFEGAERTKAMMVWAMANMFGIPLGPIVGGWLLKHYEWSSVFVINIPLAAIAVVAVGWLLPESRSAARSGLDGFGIVTSSLGLISITYGVIRAGEHSWTDPFALATIAIGSLMIAVFILWQRRAAHPLIDLTLFKSARFTWGAILATIATFAIFGLMFATPLYFQIIQGADSLSTGLRLLPMIGGLILGAKIAQSLLMRSGTKVVVGAGFAIIAVGLVAGAMTGMDSGYGYAAVWITVSGFGLGMVLPASMDAATGELSAERSGVGSALIMVMRQVGGAFGVALLGSALNATYRSQLDLTDVPESAAGLVRQSVVGGSMVARQLSSESLLHSVHLSFIHGMNNLLFVCCGFAIVGLALTLRFLPRSSGTPQTEKAQQMSL